MLSHLFSISTASIIVVVAATILLTYSLFFPVRILCREEHTLSFWWKILGLFVLFFICSFMAFGYMLIIRAVSTTELLMSLILLSGSIFVFLVVRLSMMSIEGIKKSAAKEQHRALHDDLTGLPNRLLLNDRIDHGILVAERHQESMAIVMLDLNRFKEINDALGHFYGDYVLQEIAARLRETVRKSDTVARFGGDEFAIVLPNSDLEQAIAICQKISASIEEPILIEGHNVSVGMSAGISTFPEHARDSETLLQHADVAMYEAKRNDITFVVYSHDQNNDTWKRLVLIGELRNAIRNKQLTLHYQPKINFIGGHLCGVEALVRWEHPEKGTLGPDTFIELSEQTGMINDLTYWVLNNSLEQCAIWHKEGLKINISVNLSIKNLQDNKFPDTVQSLLKTWQIKPKYLTLEITETSMMIDPKRVNKSIEKLHEIGVKIAIDDYGAGYSSLSYLRNFPAIEVKIDKSFIMNMLTNEEDAIIVNSTIDLAHNMGMQVVAEGVESIDVSNSLEKQGCDIIQGFHICKPLPVAEFNDWFKNSLWKNPRAYRSN
ncbi:MAG: EAL domain-containing protein [Proteobacteria bacterium]|nr:EAL domain-containing protein [Pseudomonadota bacterium]MBU1709965.1 EAL domain-containing protein [Pseudomonadota bacterium]